MSSSYNWVQIQTRGQMVTVRSSVTECQCLSDVNMPYKGYLEDHYWLLDDEPKDHLWKFGENPSVVGNEHIPILSLWKR